MTPTQSLQAHQNDALQAQLTGLGVRMDQGFMRLENIMSGVEGRVREVEQREAGCQPLMTSRLDAAWRRLDNHADEIKALTETIQAIQLVITELKRTQALLTWFAGVSGAAVILWFVGRLLRWI